MALNPINGTTADDSLNGTLGGDEIRADGGNDWVAASDGNDLIYGEGGSDTLQGGYGRDRIYGGAGNDIVHGGYGDDRLYGGAGNDMLFLDEAYGPTFDRAWGGAGDDLFFVRTRQGGEVYGGAGIDRLDLFWYDNFGDGAAISVALSGPSAGAFTTGTSLLIDGIESIRVQTYVGDDTVTGGDFDDEISVHAGANTVVAGGGADRIVYISGTANLIDGGDGTDTLRVVAGGELDFNVSGTSASDQHGSVITAVERFEVYGSGGADRAQLGAEGDRFHGYQGNDTAMGGAGNDRLFGRGHDDQLFGEDGNDHLNGGLGEDTLTGGAGEDVLVGGKDADHFVFTPSGGHDRVLDFEDGVDLLDVSALGLTSTGQFFGMTASGTDLLIEFDLSTSVRLVDFLLTHTVQDISAADFLFG